MDASDLKQFFETNYSQIYFIFYENFITLENSLKLKGKNFYKKIFLIYKVFFFLNKNTGSS